MPVCVTAPAGSFRRCGFAFTKHPQYFDYGYFSEEEWERIAREPHLSVREADADELEGQVVLTRERAEPEEAEEERPATADEILAAIATLDPKNDKHYTTNGQPRVDAVQAALGDGLTVDKPAILEALEAQKAIP